MDDEFRQLFQQEAEGRLTRLGESAMALESGGDPELIQELFRDAHSIKGAAAMVGFGEVARVAHKLEDILDQLRSGKRSPEPALVDVVLHAVDDLRELVALLMPGDEALAAEAATKADAAEAALAAFAGSDVPQSASMPTPSRIAAPELVPAPASASASPAAPPRPGSTPGTPAPGSDDAIAVPVDRLDELVRLVNESSAALLRVGRFIEERLGEDDAQSIAEFRELTRVLSALQERTMRARMVSVGTIAAPLRRAVRDAARQTLKQVRWEIAGEQTQLDRHVLERLRDPLMHLVRNSVDHGIEAPELRVERGKGGEGMVRLTASQVGSDVALVVSDDGGGIDLDKLRAKEGNPELTDEEAIELIFRPGTSTADEITDLSGRGVGLDVVRDALAAVRGRIEVKTALGAGTEFHIRVPMTLAALHSLLVGAGDGRFALPLQSVVTVLHPDGSSNGTVKLGDENVPVASLSETLGLGPQDNRGPAVVLEGAGGLYAFRVERLLGQRAVVVKELGDIVPRLDLVAGAAIEPDGSVMLVLDAPAVVERAA
ncbi:MAG: two-component system, chemotaxis family, sensor kinase CheA, partial [Thermoleophilaceae bacterium]|nr:two-component system, chemotaxis family, sensor kinase CheA [Thermoleophilaceae bacterium]